MVLVVALTIADLFVACIGGNGGVCVGECVAQQQPLYVLLSSDMDVVCGVTDCWGR